MNVRHRLLLASMLVSACGPFPADPDDTTERVTSRGRVRVGVTEHPPFVHRDAAGQATGAEAEMVRRFGRAKGVDVAWVWGQQEALFHTLERGEVDLVVGVHEHTPWSERLALTRPWREEPDPLVWALPQGENRWLLEVERFLAGEVRE